MHFVIGRRCAVDPAGDVPLHWRGNVAVRWDAGAAEAAAPDAPGRQLLVAHQVQRHRDHQGAQSRTLKNV